MAKSAAAYYEVRWRVKDTGEAWSTPQRVAPARQIVVEELDALARGQTYEFEARAVSNCGAKSDWVLSEHTVPDVPPGTITLPDVNDEATQAHSSVVVQNSNFTKNLNGWTFEASPGPVGSTEFQRGTSAANSPYAPIPTHLIHNGQAGQTSAYAVNNSFIPVQAGQQVVGTVALRSLGANSGARAQAFIRFYDKSGTYLGFLAGLPVLDPTGTTQLNSTAKGPAPANAAFGRICILYTGHTGGVITATCARLTATITNQDDLPDGQSYVRAPASQFHSETVDNATFTAPIDADGNIPGWKPFFDSTLDYFYSALYAANVLEITGSSANCGAETIRKYACQPGDVVSVRADMYTDAGLIAGTLQIKFFAADGSFSVANASNSAYDTWETVRRVATAPANSRYFTIIPHLPGSSGGRLLVMNVRLSINDVRVAGSGATLGNQLNAPNSLTMNYGIARSGTALSATSSGAVSVNAFTYYLGATSVSYSAKSNAVTGLTPGNTYYIYCHDLGGTGGTKSWFATTNPNTLLQNYDDIVVAGQVTIPTSGTSTGGGGGLGCPQVDEQVIRRAADGGEEAIRAGAVRVGDDLLLSSGRWGRVTYSEPSLQPGVRVEGADGSSITCSASAPLETADGPCVPAPYVRDLLLKHRTAGAVRVAEVHEVGDIWVQHITCENDCFWVGAFSHHNAKMPV